MAEQWSYYPWQSGQGTTDIVEGRTLKPWYQKINPLWWLYNSDDPTPPSWYHSGIVMWYLRNPFHNFNFYVIGVTDRNYTVTSRFLTKDKQSYVSFIEDFYRPGLSLNFKHFVFHLGWQNSGDFTIKVNFP